MMGLCSSVVLALILLHVEVQNAFIVHKINRHTFRQPVMLASNDRNWISSPNCSLQELLAELDRRKIRYAPTSTRRDLEELLKKFFLDQVTSKNAGESHSYRPSHPELQTLDEKYIRFSPTASRQELEALLYNATEPKREVPEDETLMPMETLLQQLEDNNIRFSATATRSELEAVLKVHHQNQHVVPTQEMRDRRRARRRMKLHQPQDSDTVGFRRFLSRQASRTLDRAAHRAKQLSRKASEFLFVDEDGVRDVDFQYVYKEEISTPSRPRVTVKRPTDASSRLHVQGASREPWSTRMKRADLHRLPPADSATKETPASNPRSNRRPFERQARSASGKRKIYSPYQRSDTKDAFDGFGDFIADTADRVMWGEYNSVNSRSSRRPSVKESSDPEEPRHWKDRLAERFDYLLGIHENGAYYNSWTKQVNEERKHQGGRDAFSYAQGNAPKRRGMPSRRKIYDKPIWEEEGNLISLLFGHSSSGKSLFFERLLDSSTGSLLNLFRSIFTTGILVLSYICRWASVRGALPQPLVVVTVTAAALSARPRHRLKVIAFTLILIRTLGELLHGYVYGSDGWEDDADTWEDEADDDNNSSEDSNNTD